MSKRLLSRRGFLTGAAAVAAAGSLPLLRHAELPPTYGTVHGVLLGAGDTLSYMTHRILLRNQPLVREFDRSKLSRTFPTIGTTNPEDEEYQRMLRGDFVDFRLPIKGLVDRPQSFSLAQLMQFPSRTQVTQHSCERGWSAIGEWTGVQLSRVLAQAGMQSHARYVVFECVDGWWDSIDMFDALHPQTLLAYGMNGGRIPIGHGAPIRLRVERQLGYKSLKFVSGIQVVDDLSKVYDGSGAMVAGFGYSWYAGI